MVKVIYKCGGCAGEFSSMKAAQECEKECFENSMGDLAITEDRAVILECLSDCCDLAEKCNDKCDTDVCPFAGDTETFVKYLADNPQCSLSLVICDISDVIHGYKNVGTIFK